MSSLSHRALLVVPAVIAALAGAGAATTALAQDPAPSTTTTPVAPPTHPRIAPGITAGGVDLSGLTFNQAVARLKPRVERRLRKGEVALSVAGRTFHLSTEKAGLTVNARKVAQDALDAAPPVAGATVDVPLTLSHRRSATKAFAARVAGLVARPGRNASARITLRRIVVRGSRHGIAVDQGATRKLVDAALDDPAAPRALRQRVRKVRAAVTVKQIRQRYATVITVDKSAFKLRLFKGLRVVTTYGVAVGQPAYPTPSGLFAIQDKQVNPTWSVPNSPWAGELQGTTVEGGSAENPLKARWMGIVNGVGIHGTGEDGSIGSRASHGCIRMHVSDVIALFPRVPVGTPVLLQ